MPWSRSSSVALRALEQDELVRAQRPVDEQRRVGDVGPQPLREALVALGEIRELERLGAVDALEPDVLLGERDLDLLAQDLRVEQVLDADPEPRGLVRVRRADAALASCRSAASRAAARCAWSIATCHGMIRCASPESRTTSVEMPRASRSSSSRDEDLGVDHAAAPRTHSLPWRIPDGHVVELELLVADDDRVPRVRPALVAADEVRMLGEQVDDLALPLVTPLRPDDHGRGHQTSPGAQWMCAVRAGEARTLQTAPGERSPRRTDDHGGRHRWSVPYRTATRAVTWLRRDDRRPRGSRGSGDRGGHVVQPRSSLEAQAALRGLAGVLAARVELGAGLADDR